MVRPALVATVLSLLPCALIAGACDEEESDTNSGGARQASAPHSASSGYDLCSNCGCGQCPECCGLGGGGAGGEGATGGRPGNGGNAGNAGSGGASGGGMGGTLANGGAGG